MIRKMELIKIIIIGILCCVLLVISYSEVFIGNPFYYFRGTVHIDNMAFKTDKNNNGVLDVDDLINNARQEIANKTIYKSTYYEGGYPPSTEGVCTDMIWRALRSSGYELKVQMDRDIADYPGVYSGLIKVPDPNIDFRRVKNQFIFFRRHAASLTLKVFPYNKANLYQWQRGDIVILKNMDHVAIISDKRGRDGVPLIIHNANTHPMEEQKLLKWSNQGRIIGHFRMYN